MLSNVGLIQNLPSTISSKKIPDKHQENTIYSLKISPNGCIRTIENLAKPIFAQSFKLSKKQMKKLIILFIVISSLSTIVFAQSPKRKSAQLKITEVTYIGKTGFLIKIGDKKILIDALYKGFTSNYAFPQKVQDKLSLAQAPFDNIDLILVTHSHGDHISPDMVKQHLQNNPKAIFASTEQMVNALNDFPDRCLAFNPTKEKSDSKVINDITIEAFYFPHRPKSQINNTGFVVSVNGLTLFQTGHFDTEVYKGEIIAK